MLQHIVCRVALLSISYPLPLLLTRGVKGVGIDTFSVDLPGSDRYACHEILLGAGCYLIENLTNLAGLPPIGATIIALPSKVAGAVEMVARVIALLS